MKTSVITGGSRGFGRALAGALAEKNWNLVIDARDGDALDRAAGALEKLGKGEVFAIQGDVSDPVHQQALVEAATEAGGFSLLVNNASTLGPSPMPALRDYQAAELRRVLEINVIAPLTLTQKVLPHLERGGQIINITSDAAVEAYEGWGGYGASKAALEQATAILAAEEAAHRIHWFDPGDMRTQMHQEAFPGEDISDRPLPETRVPALLALIEGSYTSGRYSAGDLLAGSAA